MSHRSSRIVVVATAFVLAAGCNEPLVSPTARGAAPHRTVADGDGPFQPNSRKYKDAGSHPATGRSGSASLQARALVGMDGNTTIDMTTGAIDEAGAPGTITKVQTKVFTLANELASVGNTKPGAPTATQVMQGLIRDQVVQLQANIKGIDGNRNDVVTIQTPVRRRPDLAVSNVQAPTHVLTGSGPVQVTALVREQNGDVGARATCALSLDGVPTDQSEGVWVDAGDAVTCAFMIRFADASDAGSHVVTVSAGSVSPGDWDTGNNSASATIAVDRDLQMSRTGSASQQTTTSYGGYESHYDYHYTCGFVCFVVHDFSNRFDENTSWTYTAAYNATSPEEIAFPVAHVELGINTGGATLDAQTFDNLQATSTFGDAVNGGSCALGFNAGVQFQLCGAHSPSGGSTTLSYTRNGGAVTYLSYGFRRYDLCSIYFPPYDIFNRCDNYVNGYYLYNLQVQSNTGASPVQYGGDFSFHALARTSDFVQFGGDLWFPLVESTTDHLNYNYCYYYPNQSVCYKYGNRVTSKAGSGTAGP